MKFNCFYCTKTYPMALMNLSLAYISPPYLATLPHELVLYPAVPNPIWESLDVQPIALLPTIPICALEEPALTLRTLNPSFCFAGKHQWSTSSIRPDPERFCDICHLQSGRTASLPFGSKQRTWWPHQPSYRDRSWWGLCSSRLVTWSLGHPSQTPLQEGRILYVRPKRWIVFKRLLQ